MERREVYWVLQHGIRHTGMPALGGSHSSADLFAIATFVGRFDEMTPQRYEHGILVPANGRVSTGLFPIADEDLESACPEPGGSACLVVSGCRSEGKRCR
jgi:hypothetical protein